VFQVEYRARRAASAARPPDSASARSRRRVTSRSMRSRGGRAGDRRRGERNEGLAESSVRFGAYKTSNSTLDPKTGPSRSHPSLLAHPPKVESGPGAPTAATCQDS
jgi:hypothetical protein